VGQRRHGNSRGLYFFLWKRKLKLSIENRMFVQHRIVSAVKRVEFVSNIKSHIVPRVCWCNIIVLNVHAISGKMMIEKTVFMRN